MRLKVQEEIWPLRSVFRIAHGAKSAANVVTIQLTDENGNIGNGECVPYPRYNESPLSVIAQIEAVRHEIEKGINNIEALELLPPCAARNALDCALWDLKAKQQKLPVWQLAGLPQPQKLQSAYTIVIDSHEEMKKAAIRAQNYPLLKIKIGNADDLKAVIAINEVRPDARLIIDANESLDEDGLNYLLKIARKLNIELIEQPFKVNHDDALRKIASPVAICADESFHSTKDIEKTVQQYDAVNIKLDKTGGFTEALRAIKAARIAGQKIMMGCMVGTSLVTAPAVLLANLVDWVDLDGPLFMAKDREFGLEFENGIIMPPKTEL
ncbi:MAG: dipeptide epimerase, partial [Caulobacterales bacterium]|nr:dipeptide epimerase [Caulobacterales bacterium]